MRCKTILILLIFLIRSSQLIAEQWSAKETYHSGDIVTYKNHYYLASYGNKNLQPIDNKFSWDGWITIKNSHLTEWEARKIYKAGSVIKFDDKNYIAKWWNREKSPAHIPSSWVTLAVGMGDKPTVDDEQNILGSDKDNNGIRDSYELFIEQNYSGLTIKSYLKTAAREYQKLLEISLDPELAESLSTEQAQLLMNDLMTFSFCNRQLRLAGELPMDSSPTAEYYNTIARSISRHQGGRVLYKKNLDESFNPYNEPNACGSLIVKGVL